MNLVKFFRKKKTVIMTWAVIILMVAFIGGTAFQQIMRQVSIVRAPKQATYGDGNAIRQTHVQRATAELEILRGLRMDYILAMRGQSQNQPDLASRLLAMLLFPDSISAASINGYLKQAVQKGELMLSENEVDAFFKDPMAPNFYYWILLNHEAVEMGIQLSIEDARAFLDNEIARMTNNQANGQMLIQQVQEASNLTEEQILEVARKMLSVMTYVDTITSSVNVTTRQMKNASYTNAQRFTGTFIRLGASDFIDDIYSPTDQQVQDQFEQYKDVLPGEITAANPYGFGYKLPAALELEYILYDLEQIKDIIDPVTSDQKEDYYRRNTSIFKISEPVDPNNPQGEKTTRLQTYVEVETQIEQQLIFERIRKKSDLIISDLRSFLNKGYMENNIQPDEADSRELKKYNRSFSEAAETIAQKYKIDMSASKTGMMTYKDARQDAFLGSMITEGQAGTAVMINRALYAMDPLNETTLNRLEINTPKPWQILGPVMAAREQNDETINVVGLIRVIDTRPQTVAQNLDETISGPGIRLNPDKQTETTTIEDQVIEDLKLVHGMEIANQRANQLSDMIQADGWEKGLEEFNKKFRSKDQQLEIEDLMGQTRASQMNLFMQAKRIGETAAQNYMQASRLIETFDSKIPAGTNEAKNLNQVIEFKPLRSVYLLQNIEKSPVSRDRYERYKPLMAKQFEKMSSDSAVLSFLNPGNIQARNNFEFVERSQPEDEQDPAEESTEE